METLTLLKLKQEKEELAGDYAGAASYSPAAAATRPSVSRTAPVNAPLAWPNNSLSSSSADRRGQWTVTNGPAACGLRR